jgi:hypothetical protein
MTREELREELKVKGLLHTLGEHHPLWQQAFSLYTEVTKDKEVSMKCKMCWIKVKKWLEK